jgi:glycosyltransferase involved in cell wall biosynthesis
MSHPKVSIVIPTYNRPKKLIRAVESVIEQTYTDWELIVVDDSSDVDAEETIPDDDRIRYIQHECNKGAPAARNTGIDASNGEFIALLDDDAWKSGKNRTSVEKIPRIIERLRDALLWQRNHQRWGFC